MNGNGFMPHGYCFLWRPGVLWLHVGSDASIGFAYYCIPLVLLYFIRKRKDLPFPFIFWLFSAFILLCGTTHLMAILVIWHPVYYAEGWVKLATALVSVSTLAALIYELPRALQMVSAAQMVAQNARLVAMVVETEERGRVALSAVVDNVFDGILTIGEHGLIKSFNATCARLFGYKPDEVLGKDARVLMPVPYEGDLAQYLQAGTGKIIGAGAREVAGLRKDGTTFPLELSITSFVSDGERFFVCCLRDITEQKAALDEREQLLTRLTNSNAELERFAYVASHDMQEPVRMMVSFSQLLAEEYAGALGEEGGEYLRIINSSAHRMRHMIRDLMDYARLEGERQIFNRVDLREELRAVQENLRQLITETGAMITADEIPAVQGSAVQIMRLLQNLVINAIKFQPPGQVPRVHLGICEDIEQRLYYVRDNGLGIKPAFIEEIFAPFRRLHTWEAIQGTGLGLSVCRKIVEGHGGRIWASSVPGEGTTIFFTLSQRA